MLFRNCDGSIIEIKKSNYKNDFIYYTNLLKLKTTTLKSTSLISKPIIQSKTTATFFESHQKNESENNCILLKQSKCNYSKQAITNLLNKF